MVQSARSYKILGFNCSSSDESIFVVTNCTKVSNLRAQLLVEAKRPLKNPKVKRISSFYF